MKGRKTGGRKKGTPNKATVARQQAITAAGITPLDFMLEGLRFHQRLVAEELGAEKPDLQKVASAFKAGQEFATDAAPYCHARLAPTPPPIDLSNLPAIRIESLSDEQLLILLARMKKAKEITGR